MSIRRKLKTAKRRIISRTADVLSFPTRSLADAKRASSDRLADSFRARRKERNTLKARIKKRGRL